VEQESEGRRDFLAWGTGLLHKYRNTSQYTKRNWLPNPIRKDYLGEMRCSGKVIFNWMLADESRLIRRTVVPMLEFDNIGNQSSR
jgi:hypothetical protein